MDEFHLLLDVEVHSPLDVFWKHCGGISRPPIGSQVFSRCNCRLGPEREREIYRHHSRFNKGDYRIRAYLPLIHPR